MLPRDFGLLASEKYEPAAVTFAQVAKLLQFTFNHREVPETDPLFPFQKTLRQYAVKAKEFLKHIPLESELEPLFINRRIPAVYILHHTENIVDWIRSFPRRRYKRLMSRLTMFFSKLESPPSLRPIDFLYERDDWQRSTAARWRAETTSFFSPAAILEADAGVRSACATCQKVRLEIMDVLFFIFIF